MSDHDIAIRAAFNAWAEAQNPKTYPAEWQAFQAGWQAALAQPQPAELPPLPEWMEHYKIPDNDFSGEEQWLDQAMREYARAAFAAMEKQR